MILCADVFSLIGQQDPSFTSLSRCLWTSDSSLQITNIGSSIQVGDFLELKSGVLKFCCAGSTTSNDREVVKIFAPSVKKLPDVVISCPNEIGSCDDFKIDYSGSSGSSGRFWKSVLIDVRSSHSNVTSLTNFVNWKVRSVDAASGLLTVPSQYLSAGYWYSFQMTLCNFLDSCATKAITVNVSSVGGKPLVAINSRNPLLIYRNTSLLLSGEASVTDCGGQSPGLLRYNWSLWSDGAPIKAPWARSISVNPLEYKLAPYQLSVGKVYMVILMVINTKTTASSVASLHVSTLAGELVCTVRGSSDMGLKVGGKVVVDMSRSIDTNFDVKTSKLVFSVTCVQIFPVETTSCLALVITSLSSDKFEVSVNSSYQNKVTKNDRYRLVLTGTSPYPEDSRSCRQVVAIYILDTFAPLIKVDLLSPSKMNPSAKVKIVGTVDISSSGETWWSVDDKSLNLQSISMSPIRRSLSVSSSPLSTQLSLVLAAESLVAPSTYTFTLSCLLTNGYSSSTSISVRTNSPPFGGQFRVMPEEGEMLKTLFQFTSVGWVDEDLPLSYEFGYVLSSTGHEPTIFRSKKLVSFTTTDLPGSPTPPNLACSMTVYDSLESSFLVFQDVRVIEVPIPLDDLNERLLNGIDSSMMSGSLDDLWNLLTSTSAVINRVNCSGAPDCVALNRKACSTVAGSCGECMDDTVGVFGPSNTPCFAINDRRHLQSPFVEPSQECPGTCSGHGRCIFVSQYDSTLEVSECSIFDTDCVARCDCDVDYSGIACSYSSDEFVDLLDLRELLAVSLGELMSSENVDRSAIISWIRTLSSISPDVVGLNVESKRKMISLTTHIFRMSLELRLSVSDLNLALINKMMEICFSSEDVSNSSSLMGLLEAYNSFVTSDMSVDQYPVSSITSFLRSSSFAVSSGILSPVLSIPSTPLELLKGVDQSTINLSSGISFPLQMSLTERKDILLNESGVQRSLPLILSFLSSPCSSSGSDCLISVTLMNKFPSAESSDVIPRSPSYETACHDDVVEEHVFICPSGPNLMISCNGSFSGYVRATCPVNTTKLVCDISVQSSSKVSNNVCHTLSSSNESATVCVCDLSKISDSGPIAFSIVSIQKSVVKDFVLTWKTAPSLNLSDVTNSWRVLLTVGSLGCIFIVALLVADRTDRSDRRKVSEQACLRKTGKRLMFVGVPKTANHVTVSQDSTLIESSLPAIFKSDSLWNKFKQEMQVYHRWLGIFCHYSPGFPRSMRVLSLFSSIIIMLFVQSVTYNIADADDGSCQKCEDIACCESLKSSLNSNQNQCYWEYDADMSSGSCHFRDIGEDIQRVLIVAMISTVISAPFALVTQYLVMNILSKDVIQTKTNNAELLKKQVPHVSTLVKTSKLRSLGASRLGDDLIESCGGSFQDDLKCLLKDLTLCRERILKSRVDLLEEFEDEWGSLLAQQETLLTIFRSYYQFLFTDRDVSREDRAKDIMHELKCVRQEVLKEYHRFRGFVLESPDSSLSLSRQRQRLVYLLVKDLARGATSDLIENKTGRASQYSDSFGTSVSMGLKWISWVAVILMNGGMLFYVYLFAMNQSESRQYAWFQTFVMWLFFEVFVSSTMLVVVVHILFPLYVFTDVLKLKEKVLADLMRLRNQYITVGEPSSKYKDGDIDFNAAKYFFPSWRVAWLFPELPESKLILQFKTLWPKKKFGVEEGNVSKEYEDDVILTAVSQVLLFFLTSLLHYHSLFQDILIQTVSNCGLGYISLLTMTMRLYCISPFLVLVVVVVLIVSLHFVVKYLSSGLHKRLQHAAHQIRPIPNEQPALTSVEDKLNDNKEDDWSIFDQNDSNSELSSIEFVLHDLCESSSELNESFIWTSLSDNGPLKERRADESNSQHSSCSSSSVASANLLFNVQEFADILGDL